MKSFLIKLLKILVCFYIVLWIIQLVFDNGLQRNEKDLYSEWYKMYNTKIDADLVFLGNSRTVSHYDPYIFEEGLGLGSYNLGNSATNYDLQMLKRDVYFENNKTPKVIVQNVDITSLRETNNLYQKEQYFPYYTLNNYKYLTLGDKTITSEYLLPMFKYRSFYKLRQDVIDGYFNNKNSSILVKGYGGVVRSWNNEFEKQIKLNGGKLYDYSYLDLDKRFEVFNNLLNYLKKLDTEIFLVWAPEYYKRVFIEGETLVNVKNRYINIANTNENVYFLDFTQDSLCYSKDYFFDSFHLNKTGAEIFSHKVVDSIKKHLKFEYK